MPSQNDFANAKHFELFEDPTEGGQLMTKNQPSMQTQRPVITNRGKRSPFKADVRLVSCIHGSMSDLDSTAASLVVVEYHLICTGEHRYTSLVTRLGVQNHRSGDLQDEPFVKAFAPFKHSEKLDSVDVEHSNKRHAEGSVGLSFTPAELNMLVGWEAERRYKIQTSAFGQAIEEYTDGKMGSDAVVWELKENKTKQAGVPDTFRVALLVQRANSEKFVGDFSLQLHGGLWLAASNGFKSFVGIIEEDDPIVFDPSLPPQGDTAGITPSCLGIFADQQTLQSLTPIHLT